MDYNNHAQGINNPKIKTHSKTNHIQSMSSSKTWGMNAVSQTPINQVHFKIIKKKDPLAVIDKSSVRNPLVVDGQVFEILLLLIIVKCLKSSCF